MEEKIGNARERRAAMIENCIAKYREKLGEMGVAIDDGCREEFLSRMTALGYLSSFWKFKLHADDIGLRENLKNLTLEEVRQVLSVARKQAKKPRTYVALAIAVKRGYGFIGRKDLYDVLEVPKYNGAPAVETLSQDEVKRLIESTECLRDRLIIELLAETGARIGELANLRIRDVQFDEYSAILWLDGKTGRRTVRVFMAKPDPVAYLNNHPKKNDSESSLLFSTNGVLNIVHSLTVEGIRYVVKTIGRQVLGKRVYPHMFRHTRFTQLSRVLTDREMKILGGWRTTKMLEVYSHLSGRDVDDKILALHGLKSNSEMLSQVINTRKCRECGQENAPVAIYCQHCGNAIGVDAELKARVEKLEKVLLEEVFHLKQAQSTRNYVEQGRQPELCSSLRTRTLPSDIS